MSHSLGDKNDFPSLEYEQALDGRFVIGPLIGRGGQGRVFRVRHMEWDRDFALKLPLAKVVETGSSRELFLKEAEAWIRLGVHPNIVRCWFVRPIGDLPGLFLDLMAGGSLKSQIRTKAVRPGQWDKIMLILLQVLEGLTHAHSKGMVHRDLKPENLMVNAEGRVCITDFGLVKTLGERDLVEGTDAPLPTNSAVTAGAMGTPRYGAPEQWLNPAQVNQTTDLYSLGVIMYELLCGQRPFEPPGPAPSPIEIIERHITQEPSPPNSIKPDIPPDLAALCLRLMSKGMEERPATAKEVLQALTGLLNSRGNLSYQRPAIVPGGERADLLNNAASSLFSLGKPEKARELLLKGLMLEAGHPQCLYNLIQLDLKQGKIEREEAWLRLERARAFFGMALLYIEAGRGKEAAELLNQEPGAEKTGLLHRLEGDALMYAGDFKTASQCYEKAAQQMPHDLATRFRLKLAVDKSNMANGRVYFPASKSLSVGHCHRRAVLLALSPNAEMIVATDESEIVGLSVHDSRVLHRAKRELYASPPLWSDSYDSILLLQDRKAFELWNLDNLHLLSRLEGRVVARDGCLGRLLVLTGDGLSLYDRSHQKVTSLRFDPRLEVSANLLASFTYDGTGIGVLTPDGSLSSLNASAQIVPLGWPQAIESPSQVSGLCLGRDYAAMVYRSSLLRCFCFTENRISAQLELGFLPSSLENDKSGDLIIASSPKAHTVLDKEGRIRLSGRGPIALDPSRKLCLVWSDGCLQLYQLNPNQHLRSWDETVLQPHTLQVSRDGRRALSIDEEGAYRVWDVDEDHRVFERNLLMTPGQSYSEIITTFQEHRAELESANRHFDNEELEQANAALKRARSVNGFQQSKQALALQWELCGVLQRESLEAVWERLYIPDTVSGMLSADCRHLLLAKHRSVELLHLSGPSIDSRLKIPIEYQILSAHLFQIESGEGVIIVLGQDGVLSYYSSDSGKLQFQDNLKTGRLSSARFWNNLALLQTTNEVYSLDLSSAKISKAFPMLERTLKRAFFLDDQQVLVVTHQGNLLTDLKKNHSKPGFPADQKFITSEITFCSDEPTLKIRIIGLKDGTLMITQRKTGQPLLTVRHDSEAIESAALHLETSLGVSVSRNGWMTLFDLSTGNLVERFIAHKDGIADLSMTQDGRYLTTRSSQGQFRLWEISWRLSDKRGTQKIDWLASSALEKLSRFFKRS